MRRVALLAVLGLLAGCGGSGDGGPKAPVERYLKALGSSDAPGACRELTEKSREQLAEFGKEHLKSKETCTAAIGTLMKAPAGKALRDLGKAEITKVETHGKKAQTTVKGLDRPIDVVETGGRWRIRSTPSGETD